MDNNIIDTNFYNANSDEVIYYTIEQVSKKINISETKINHLIFKFNKTNKDFKLFENADKISQYEMDRIEIVIDLLNSGLNYDEVVDYFKNNSHELLDRETGEIKKDLSLIDSQVIAKNVSIEITKKMDRLENSIINTISNNVSLAFQEEAKKIAQVSLDAMEQTRNDMLNYIDVMTDKIEVLEKRNIEKDKELERLYSKDVVNMREKLLNKDKELELLKKQLEFSNKGLLSKIFGKKNDME